MSRIFKTVAILGIFAFAFVARRARAARFAAVRAGMMRHERGFPPRPDFRHHSGNLSISNDRTFSANL